MVYELSMKIILLVRSNIVEKNPKPSTLKPVVKLVVLISARGQQTGVHQFLLILKEFLYMLKFCVYYNSFVYR